MRSSSIRPGLNPEAEEVKRKLAKCHPRVYFELIRSDILGPSGVSHSRALASRPSLPFVMKTSREGPLVKSLAKKKRSVKHKAQAPLESSLTIQGKVSRL